VFFSDEFTHPSSILQFTAAAERRGIKPYRLTPNKYKDIKIYNTSFEEYNDKALFDAIFSATAFHWCDIKIK
jgi:hypothetical protein